MLVVHVLVVGVLILQAYVNVNRSTAIFGKVTFLTGNLVNVQREALLLNVKIEELPTTHDGHGAQVRREDAALANAIVKLSHTLQLHTVAEGIEEPEQATNLVALGCQDGQGYPFARPLAAPAMTDLPAKTVGDGGFHLPVAQPAGSLFEVG